MRILVTGATGYIGVPLCTELVRKGHEIHVLTRSLRETNRRLPFPCKVFLWENTSSRVPPKDAFEGVDAVVHLAGESIAGSRWTDAIKKRIYDSRVLGTRQLIKGLKAAGVQPKVFVSTSAIGYYGEGGEEVLSEDSVPGKDFLAQVCEDWEYEVEKKLPESVRRVILRVGVVIGRGGGFLQKLRPLIKLRLLGKLSWGKQWASWIHKTDLIRLYLHAIDSQSMSGVYNAVAPETIRNADLTGVLCKQANVLQGPPVPSLAIKLVYGEMSSFLLASQKVSAEKTLSSGFSFQYAKFSEAIEASYERNFFENLFEAQQWFPQGMTEVFEFFSEAKNLEQITPDFINFKVKAMSTSQIEKGTLIDYSLKIHGIPAHWRTLIDEWEPGKLFVDTQIKGPYSVWHHQHHFEELAGGTLVTDKVHYKLPMGILGDTVAGAFVAKDVSTIFKHRFKSLESIFPTQAGS